MGTASTPNSAAANTPTAEPSGSAPTNTNQVRPGGAPARVYMNEKIVPYLLEGMKTVAKEQYVFIFQEIVPGGEVGVVKIHIQSDPGSNRPITFYSSLTLYNGSRPKLTIHSYVDQPTPSVPLANFSSKRATTSKVARPHPQTSNRST